MMHYRSYVCCYALALIKAPFYDGSEFALHDFRNIKNARLQLKQGIHLIYGENGSGKTALLEVCFA